MGFEKKALVTGGAGFIGRWVVKELLDNGLGVQALDSLSNSSASNLDEFADNENFLGLVQGDIRHVDLVRTLFQDPPDLVVHLAAQINVQHSIDRPRDTFEIDIFGTFELLELCRAAGCRVVFMSTCMVYDMAGAQGGIDERHPVKPASPYAAAKLAGEQLTLSYHHAYGLPVVILRPFNTYGPFQKATGEGGVVSIFLKRQLSGQTLDIYGDGTQTRDLLFVTDCARFVRMAALDPAAEGRIINAGTGCDIAINDLARTVTRSGGEFRHVEHIHPQSEIPRLRCNPALAGELLGWTPEVGLEQGLELTRRWFQDLG